MRKPASLEAGFLFQEDIMSNKKVPIYDRKFYDKCPGCEFYYDGECNYQKDTGSEWACFYAEEAKLKYLDKYFGIHKKRGKKNK